MTTDNAAEAIICAVLLEVQAELDGGDLGELERAAKELRRLHALNHELLDALKRIAMAAEATACNVGWVAHHARAAIAKATGE